MTILQAAQDVRYLISDFFPTSDTRISYGYALNLVNQKRAAWITDDYKKRGLFNNQWLSDLAIEPATQVDFSNNLDDQSCNCNVGRITIPPVVRMDYDKLSISDVGVHTIKSTCGVNYDKCSQRKFIALWNSDSPYKEIPYYWHEGNFIYMYPFRDEINSKLVLESPLDGKYIRSEYVVNGEMIIGKNYKVTEGNITYDTGGGPVVIQSGTSFAANVTGGKSWTGNGKVKFLVLSRSAEWNDNYPLDGATFSMLKNLILEEFRAAKVNVMDVVDDGAVEEGIQKSKA